MLTLRKLLEETGQWVRSVSVTGELEHTHHYRCIWLAVLRHHHHHAPSFCFVPLCLCLSPAQILWEHLRMPASRSLCQHDTPVSNGVLSLLLSLQNDGNGFSSSSSSSHKIRPINDLFHPQDCNCVVVSLKVVQVLAFWWVNNKQVVLGVYVHNPPNVVQPHKFWGSNGSKYYNYGTIHTDVRLPMFWLHVYLWNMLVPTYQTTYPIRPQSKSYHHENLRLYVYSSIVKLNVELSLRLIKRRAMKM